MNRTLLLYGIVLGMALTAREIRAEESGVVFFQGTWSQILAEAKSQGKPIYIDCYTSWCAPCVVMKKELFPDEEVAAYLNANFIACSFDMEQGEGLELARRYGVSSYPTNLFVDPEGRPIHRAVGGGGIAEYKATFMRLLHNVGDPEHQYYTLKSRYEAGDRSADLLYRYAFAASEAYAEDRFEIAKAYFKTQNDSDLYQEKNWEAIRRLVFDADFREFTFLVKHRDEFAERYGSTEVDTRILEIATNTAYKARRQQEYTRRIFEKSKQRVAEVATVQEKKKLLKVYLNFYEMVEDWPSYAAAAIEYVQTVGMNDAEELNALAWTLHEHSEDRAILTRAAEWARTSVALKPSYANADSYAAILYKLGDYAQAAKVAESAIALAKQEGADDSSIRELLRRINAGGTDGKK